MGQCDECLNNMRMDGEYASGCILDYINTEADNAKDLVIAAEKACEVNSGDCPKFLAIKAESFMQGGDTDINILTR